MKSIEKMMRLMLFLGCCIIGVPTASGTLVLDDGLTHDIDWNISDNVEVRKDSFWNRITTINLIAGGSVGVGVYGGRTLTVHDSCIINISGGSVDYYLYARDHSKVTISRGSVHNLHANNNSRITVTGGSIGGEIHAGQSALDNSIITLVGSDFAINGISVKYGDYSNIGMDSVHGILTGVLTSGDFLNNTFYIWGDSKIVLAREPDPAPYCTEFPVGDLNEDCHVDFRDFALMAENWMQCNLEPQSACWSDGLIL